MKKKRPQLKIRGHYRIIDGKKTRIDPFSTDLPDICLLVTAEIATGMKFELSNSKKLKVL
ncbi:hypothetical protein HUB98_13295 [Paenibacillus barcinonensis]|uniref:Uncharacterized protein n=1 Tax=Paenibacillus barcinonensis TaxID=198119 RepID=A0A2V4VU31_PAEBA|nr:hypothetical protein [Paenibacillus barcinonensis]PYE42355.1 hypothetical protein DFQ00_1383 [Paenibacillus barcinonensis]QKS57194.1 hypothetical protein HUB98_13295 [Paenibacillus barcinonensis]